MDREGREYAPAVWRHVKVNICQIMERHSATITDDTVCDQIWNATCALVEYYLDGGLPDETVEEWERQLAGWPE